MNFRRVVTAVCMLTLTGCAHTGKSTTQEIGRLIAPSLSKKAFERSEPVLKKLRPGQAMSTSGLTWSVRELRQGTQRAGILSIGDGWAGALSGDALGALSQIGEIEAIRGGKVFGSHIYGYIREPAVFIPRYEVKTVGTIVSIEEFTDKKGQGSYAWYLLTDETTGKRDDLYLKDVEVVRVTEIPLNADEHRYSQHQMPVTAPAQLFSRERFTSAEDKIRSIKPGTDVWGVLTELNGLITANYGGVSFLFNIDGLLKYTGEHAIAKRNRDGVWSVWPFGYVEDGHEVPKLAVIFRDGVVDKVVQYSTKEAMIHLLK